MPPPTGGIRTHNLSRRAAVDLRLRPRGQLDRLYDCVTTYKHLHLQQLELLRKSHVISHITKIDLEYSALHVWIVQVQSDSGVN